MGSTEPLLVVPSDELVFAVHQRSSANRGKRLEETQEVVGEERGHAVGRAGERLEHRHTPGPEGRDILDRLGKYMRRQPKVHDGSALQVLALLPQRPYIQ